MKLFDEWQQKVSQLLLASVAANTRKLVRQLQSNKRLQRERKKQNEEKYIEC